MNIMKDVCDLIVSHELSKSWAINKLISIRLCDIFEEDTRVDFKWFSKNA